MRLRRRKIFRWCVDTADSVNFWIEKRFDLNPKRAILEAQQNTVSLGELERTVGKSLGL